MILGAIKFCNSNDTCFFFSQLISDVRDFSTTAANIDRKLPSAWINAPVLLAWDELPEMGPLIKREFNEEGDVEKVFCKKRQLYCSKTLFAYTHFYIIRHVFWCIRAVV